MFVLVIKNMVLSIEERGGKGEYWSQTYVPSPRSIERINRIDTPVSVPRLWISKEFKLAVERIG
jgi:hypothetical protein